MSFKICIEIFDGSVHYFISKDICLVDGKGKYLAGGSCLVDGKGKCLAGGSVHYYAYWRPFWTGNILIPLYFSERWLVRSIRRYKTNHLWDKDTLNTFIILCVKFYISLWIKIFGMLKDNLPGDTLAFPLVWHVLRGVSNSFRFYNTCPPQ